MRQLIINNFLIKNFKGFNGLNNINTVNDNSFKGFLTHNLPLIAPNAWGKTSILEALAFLFFGRNLHNLTFKFVPIPPNGEPTIIAVNFDILDANSNLIARVLLGYKDGDFYYYGDLTLTKTALLFNDAEPLEIVPLLLTRTAFFNKVEAVLKLDTNPKLLPFLFLGQYATTADNSEIFKLVLSVFEAPKYLERFYLKLGMIDTVNLTLLELYRAKGLMGIVEQLRLKRAKLREIKTGLKFFNVWFLKHIRTHYKDFFDVQIEKVIKEEESLANEIEKLELIKLEIIKLVNNEIRQRGFNFFISLIDEAEVKEQFLITYCEIPFKDLNTATKLDLSLELCEFFQSEAQLLTPLFLDNLELLDPESFLNLQTRHKKRKTQLLICKTLQES